MAPLSTHWLRIYSWWTTVRQAADIAFRTRRIIPLKWAIIMPHVPLLNFHWAIATLSMLSFDIYHKGEAARDELLIRLAPFSQHLQSSSPSPPNLTDTPPFWTGKIRPPHPSRPESARATLVSLVGSFTARTLSIYVPCDTISFVRKWLPSTPMWFPRLPSTPQRWSWPMASATGMCLKTWTLDIDNMS